MGEIFNEIGRFTARIGKPKVPTNGSHNETDHPLSVEPSMMSEKDVDIFTWMYDNKNIPTAMRDELVNYLKQAKKIRDKAARANEKRLKQQQAKEAEQAARLSVLHENEDMNKKRKPLQTPPSGTSSNNNTPSTNASSRRRKKGGNKNKKKKKQRGGGRRNRSIRQPQMRLN